MKCQSCGKPVDPYIMQDHWSNPETFDHVGLCCDCYDIKLGMPTPTHIAPPNWYTLCGLTPSHLIRAYDFCSLPEDSVELHDPSKWCPACVMELEKEVEHE